MANVFPYAADEYDTFLANHWVCCLMTLATRSDETVTGADADEEVLA